MNIAATATANSSLVLAGANDIVVHPGYIGVGAEPALNEVIFRFAGQVPDDVYRIDIFGTGATPLKNVNGETYLDGKNSDRGLRVGSAPQIVSVVPQPVLRLANGSLAQERNKVAVYFNNDDLDLASAQNPKFYQLVYTNETLENTDDLVFNPISVQYSADKDMAILTFASDLATLAPQGAGTYRLRIGTDELPATGSTPNPMPAPPIMVTPQTQNQGVYNGVAIDFLGLSEQWGQAVRIEVAESNFGVDSRPKVTVLDNVISVELNTYAAAGNVYSPSTAQQMVDAINSHFDAGQQVLASVDPAAGATVITGVAHAPVTLLGLGSSYSTATTLGTLTEQNQVVRGLIEPQVYRPVLPGGNDDPGHRDAPVLPHLADDSADTDTGITRIEYNFRQDIGFILDSQGNRQSAFNIITETQKRRAREVLQVLNDLVGVEFVETERDGIIIASGDMAAFNPNQPLLVYDVNLDDRFNGGWFRSALGGIASSLGLGYALSASSNATLVPPSVHELPGLSVGDIDTTRATAGYEFRSSNTDLDFTNTLEPTILSDNDLLHLRHLYFPESKDIDLFRFELAGTAGKPDALGRLVIETMAERQLQASSLDTALTLWRANPDGTYELLARNDNYFGRDSYLEMQLGPGVYYVGVSASGNDEYDPIIEDSGFGGTTQGEYELRLNYRPDADEAIVDADNPNNAATFIDGDGDGVPGGVYNFWFRTQTPQNTLFVDKSAANGGTGTLAAPYNNLNTALTNAKFGQIVRVEGTLGLDGKIQTLADNPSYQIGFNSLGAPLPDGSTMEIPKGVTVMVDSGAVFQMRRARIGVGSSSAGIDRSGGAFQILGAPILLTDSNGNNSLDISDAGGAKHRRHAGGRQRVLHVVQRPDNRPGHEPVRHDAGGRRLGRHRVPQRRGPHAGLLPILGRRHLPELRQPRRHALRRRQRADQLGAPDLQSDPHHGRPADGHLQHDFPERRRVDVRQPGQL